MKKYLFLFILLGAVLCLQSAVIAPYARAEPMGDEDSVQSEDMPQIESEAGVQTDGGTAALQNAVPEEADEILDGFSVSDALDGEAGLSRIWDELKENGLGIFKTALKSGAMLLVIVLLSSIVASVMSDGGPKDMAYLCGSIAVSATAVSNVSSFIGLGMKTLDTLSSFSKALLPALCTAAVSSGAFTSATAKYAATTMFMDILLTLGTSIIMPLVSVYIAAVIAGAVLGKETLSRVAKLLKWVCTALLGLFVLVFTSYLSITGIITGKADELATRAAKTALSALLPVVGEAISNAAETLVAGAGLLRNSIGIFGMLVVVATCLFPVLRLGAHYLVYKGTAALSEAIADKRMAELIDGIGTAFGLVLGLVGAAGAMIFISVYSSMKAMGIG